MARRVAALGGSRLMGQGDQLMATGLARGAKARGKRIAFGDGRNIIWDNNSAAIFRCNPNIARPGSERDSDIEWTRYYKGHRIYNRLGDRKWIWNLDFHATPGEMFLDDDEKIAGLRHGSGFVLIESNVEAHKSVAPNKDWGRAKYQAVADYLMDRGVRVAQFSYAKGAPPLGGVEIIRTLSFRDAIAILANAALYVGPEGGLHHAAAAVGIPGVVLFGGFIPPSVTGYETHTNLTGGAVACGSLLPCQHCKKAMQAISVEEVCKAALERLHMVDKNAPVADGDRVQRRVAGYHDFRMDGMSDLVLRAHGKSVFDIGCNRGMVGFEFACNGATTVHGCDIYERGIMAAREVFADLRKVDSRFEVIDLTGGPASLKAFDGQQYDITLCLATYHKLKRIMKPADLTALMQHFGEWTKGFFAWRGTSDKPVENEQEIAALDRDLGAIGMKRIHTSYISAELGAAAIWTRS
jgi:hypothetical protein